MSFIFKKENIYSIDEVSEHLEVDITKLIEDCNNNLIKARKNCDKYFVTGENLYRYFHCLSDRQLPKYNYLDFK